MLQLCYASNACHPMNSTELADLLSRARVANEKIGVTGMLLYESQSFIQVLEGDPALVMPLFDKIGRDRRHERVMLLFRQDTDKRSFDGWNMGFFHADAKSVLRLPGYSNFFAKDFSRSSFWRDADRARELFLQFREGKWRRHVAA